MKIGNNNTTSRENLKHV